jgi:hypothetical protein
MVTIEIYATAYRCLSGVTSAADIATVASVIMGLPVDVAAEKLCAKVMVPLCYELT